MDYRVISADDHIDLVWLPKDVWQKRVPAAVRDRVPRVEDFADGPEWVCGSERLGGWGLRRGAASGGVIGNAGRRSAFEKAGVVLEPGIARPTTPELRLADMDRDGVDASVMYGPIVPILIHDTSIGNACTRAYNEWLVEFCANSPERLIGAGLVPIDDPKAAAASVRHIKSLGLKTAMFLGTRVELPLWDEAWNPLWEAASETKIPLGIHFSGALKTVDWNGPKAHDPGNMGVRISCTPTQVDEPFAALMFSGAFERFPDLRIVLAETGIGWLPYMLERMDDTYEKFLDAKEYWNAHGGLRLSMKPSAYFRRQAYATFQNDKAGVRNLDLIGVDNVMWASDYPHADSTWPRSEETRREGLASIPEPDRRKIVCENARKLYRL
jgi:uncharacterized protein